MKNLLIYSRPNCHFCKKLKSFLDLKGLEYYDINLQERPEKQEEMELRTNGIGSVPQLFVGDLYIGDCFTVLSESGQEKLMNAIADSSQ